MPESIIDKLDVVFDAENIVQERKIRGCVAALGCDIDECRFKVAYEQISKLYDLRSRVYSKEIEAILAEVENWPQDSWTINGVIASVTKSQLPRVKLELIDPKGEEFTAEASGDTTVDAICTAIEHATGIHVFLLDFSFTSLVPGINSLGQANVRIKHHNYDVNATAYSIDFLEAVAKAFLLGVNIVKDKIKRRSN